MKQHSLHVRESQSLIRPPFVPLEFEALTGSGPTPLRGVHIALATSLREAIKNLAETAALTL